MSKEKIREAFFEFVDRMRGRVPIKSRLAPLTNPDEIRTSTILSPSQVSFVANAYWLGETYPKLFGGLQKYAKDLMYPAISKRGTGRDQMIAYVGAMSEAQVLSKLGVTVSGEKGGE